MGNNNKKNALPQNKGSKNASPKSILTATEQLWLEVADKAIVNGEISNELKVFLENAENEGKVKDLVSYLLELVKSYDSLKQENQKTEDNLKTERKILDKDIESANAKIEQANTIFANAATKENELSKKEDSLTKYEEALSKRDIAITKREDDYEDGKYTGIVSQVLGRLSETKAKIMSDTETLISKLGEASTVFDDNALKYAEKLAQIEKERDEILAQKAIYEKAKLSLKEDRENMEEAARESAREEFSDELSANVAEIESLTKENKKLAGIAKELKGKVERIEAAFEENDPVEMAKDYNSMKAELEKATEKLASAPTAAQLSRMQNLLDQKENKIEELEGLLDRQMILEDEKLHDKTQFNIGEISILKDKLATAEYKENRYKENLKSLQEIIDEMKADKINCQDAFRFARLYDDDSDIQAKPRFGTDTNGLFGLVDYVQNKLALDIDEVGDKKKALLYDKDLLRFFVAGLNMSQISILQGISGTGKTSLPREFIKAITAGIEEYYGNNDKYDEPNAPYRICEVQAGWRDNMDLMGYYNSFEKRYNETKFFKALYLANTPKYKDTLFFIILDEMNLSRPEHYFADFLSLLEQNEDERFIDVRVSEQSALPNLAKKGKLCVPKNVRFIGTANHDETTLEFAPKTYDRSNIIEMPKNKGIVANPKDMTRSVSYLWLEKEFKKAENEYEDYYLVFKDFINNKAHALFTTVGIGTGNRFEEQAFKFITAFIATGDEELIDESLAKAADHLITRRLFRILKGNYDIRRDVLKTFRDKYEELFLETFDFVPEIAHDFFEEELKNKKS